MISLKNIWFVFCALAALCFVGCKEDEPYFVSMNVQEKYLFIGDQFLFTVIQQGKSADSGGVITWTVSDPEYLRIDSINSKGMYATALKESNEGVTVRGELTNGRYAMGKVFVQQRMAGDSDLSFASNEIYMSAGTTDSVELRLSKEFLKKFPDVKVRSSNPELLEASLQITDSVSFVKFRTLSSSDGESIVTVSAGNKEVNCKVNIGVYLYLSFGNLDMSLGKPQVVPKESFTFLISSNKPSNALDTIKVRYLAIPDDAAHLAGINFKVTTAGEHGVVWVKGFEKKYVDNSHFLYVYVETSENKGLAQVIIESLGNKVTADVDVIDKNDIQVKKMKFKKEVYNSETNLDMFSQITVDPLQALAYWPITWSITDANIASIDANGFLTIKKAGSFEVKASLRNAIATCTVNSLLRVLSVTLPAGDKDYAVGEKELWNPTISANFREVDSKHISWKSSNTSVATVDSKGEISALAAGSSQITVTITDDFGGSYTATKDFVVVDYNIYNLNFTASDHSYYADRSASRLLLSVYPNSDDETSYDITLNLKTGSWDLSKNKTYTIGQELTNNGMVAFAREVTSAYIQSGSISVNNGVITFNLTASKGAKTITVKGAASAEK